MDKSEVRYNLLIGSDALVIKVVFDPAYSRARDSASERSGGDLPCYDFVLILPSETLYIVTFSPDKL